MMTDYEIQAIEDCLKSYSRPVNAVEWGCGNSTLHFSRLIPAGGYWTAVEHDPQWHTKIDSLITQESVENTTVHLVKTNRRFDPSNPDDGDFQTFEDYVKFPLSLDKPPDVFLVDGRARAECLRIAWSMMSEDGVVILHDALREQYAKGLPENSYWIRILDIYGRCGVPSSLLFLVRSLAKFEQLKKRIRQPQAEGIMVRTSNFSPTRLSIFSDKKYLPSGARHVPMLIPFWGNESRDHPDAGRFDRYESQGAGMLNLCSLEEADVALLPAEYSTEAIECAGPMLEEAQKLQKPVLIFFNHDSASPLGLQDAIVFRTSLLASDQSKNEFAVPAWSVDFTERYLGGRLPVRRYRDRPAVGFCGHVQDDPGNLRRRAIDALRTSAKLDTNLIANPSFWGGAYTQGRFGPDTDKRRKDYVSNMVESDYIICARGAGNFSYRFYETLSCGRIPIFINSDCVLPFSDEIDWRQHCVWIEQDEVESLGEKVAEFHAAQTPETFFQRQLMSRELWRRWLCPEGFFSQLGAFLKKRCATSKPPQTPTPQSSIVINTGKDSQPRKCVFLNTYYPGFLKSCYSSDRTLASAPYDEQMAKLTRRCFGDSNFYSRGLTASGWAAEDIVVNCEPLQRAWAREHCTIPLSTLTDITVEQLRRKKPDVVYLQDLSLATQSFLEAIRKCTDLVVGQIASPLPPHTAVSRLDAVISSFPHFVNSFRANNITSFYQPLAFEPEVLRTLSEENRDHPVTFIGSLSETHSGRTKFLEEVSRHVPIEVWGCGAELLSKDSPLRACHKGEAWGIDAFKLLARSSITLNHHIDAAADYANNMRIFEATGCGALLITDYKHNLQEFFDIGTEIVAYRSIGECIELIRYYLAHPDEARRIATAGQARVLQDHTYAIRMKETATLLERQLERKATPLPVVSASAPSGYRDIDRDDISSELLSAWQRPEVADRQRALISRELKQMYEGEPPVVYQVLAQAVDPLAKNGDAMLEIGCASGYYHEVLSYLTRKQLAYTGVDYSESMLKLAREHYPEASFVHADGARLPFDSSSFEIVVSGCVLLHVPNYAQHIEETARVARNYIVAHRTPICRNRETTCRKKQGYEVEMIEFIFNENEFCGAFYENGFRLLKTIELSADRVADSFNITYVFQRRASRRRAS